MKKLIEFLLSPSLMGFLVLFLAVASGTATFIESNYGPLAARAAVYNIWWFELILLLLAISILGNMIIKRTYKKRKLTIFLYHIAFILIFLGAAVTRYISYEGTMHIREGSSSAGLLTSNTWLSGSISTNGNSTSFHKKVLFVPGGKNKFRKKVNTSEGSYTIRLKNFISSAQPTLVPDPAGEPILNLVILNMHVREDHMLRQGDTIRLSGILIGFDNPSPDVNVSFFTENGRLRIKATQPVIHMDMNSQVRDTLQQNEAYDVSIRNMYALGFLQIVPSAFQDKASLSYTPGNQMNSDSPDVLAFNISGPGGQKTVYVPGHPDMQGVPVRTTVGNTQINLQYGARMIELPFSLYLNDFQIERYPGSNSPSSYASEVTVVDPQTGTHKPFRIYMNHILKYKGYRFFQSSYDQDEKGTILSVNHDSMGTTLTYLGYFLMMFSMVLSIFNKNSRFMKLGNSINLNGTPKKIASAIALLVFTSIWSPSGSVSAQNILHPEQIISVKQAKAFSDVLVQDQGGRIKPFETLASEVVRKVAYKSSINGITPARVVLSMYFYPSEWQRVPMIRVSDNQIRYMLGLDGNFASFYDFFDPANNNSYKLAAAVQQAYKKDPSTRSKLDQDIIKVDERVNICYLVYTGSLLKIFPASGDPQNRWYSPGEAAKHVPSEDSAFVRNSINLYFTYIHEDNGDNQIIPLIDGIKKFQRTRAAGIIPAEGKIKMEIFYNKAGIFEKLSMIYGLFGFLLLIILFFHILIPRLKIKGIIKGTVLLIGVGFIFHTVGLGIRWYISGHAPWSNGYESMIYIAWAMVLAGILFARKSPFALAAGGILSALTLFVAHLSWMSPEITNLVPVLKSYWLSIHVSVITASYGFLGMGMVLGLFNLILLLFKSRKNDERISQTVTTLTRINEMTLILGLYFISIGTFLGGIWANESWGRYWGWDPKETWALITMMVYVFVVHQRFIPGLRGEFAFNLGSVLGFSSVIMTYFGVNYYLSGLHSYAAGEAAPIPVAVYFIVAILGLIVLFAWLNEKRFRKVTEPEP